MGNIQILEEQIRQCFGRVVYTHKTHEKMADILALRLSRLKIAQIFFNALTSSALLGLLVCDQLPLKIATTVISLISLCLTSYMKSFDLGGLAQKHRDAAVKLLDLRESYLSLITDLNLGEVDVANGLKKRDQLQKQLVTLFFSAPQTNNKAYKAAQKALKKLEDYTFSDEEIDKFLPTKLRKGK